VTLICVKTTSGKQAVDREQFFQLSTCEYNLRVTVRTYEVAKEWNLLPPEVVKPVQKPPRQVLQVKE